MVLRSPQLVLDYAHCELVCRWRATSGDCLRQLAKNIHVLVALSVQRRRGSVGHLLATPWSQLPSTGRNSVAPTGGSNLNTSWSALSLANSTTELS